jgi:hypothetical protein
MYRPTVDIRVYCDPRLKDLAIDAASSQGVPLSELVVRALAKYLNQPELAKVPRISIGRPPLRSVPKS